MKLTFKSSMELAQFPHDVIYHLQNILQFKDQFISFKFVPNLVGYFI